MIFVSFFIQTAIFLSMQPLKSDWFIIARGTKSKNTIVSKQFNLADTNITHIGFAKETVDKKFIIYHINAIKGNAFTIDSLSSFLSPQDIFYYGIWKLRLSKYQEKLLDNFINHYVQTGVQFDFDFHLNNGAQKVYCSEFVWMGLNKINMNINPSIKDLSNDSLKAFFKKDTVHYIPADFFINRFGIQHHKSEFISRN